MQFPTNWDGILQAYPPPSPQLQLLEEFIRRLVQACADPLRFSTENGSLGVLHWDPPGNAATARLGGAVWTFLGDSPGVVVSGGKA